MRPPRDVRGVFCTVPFNNISTEVTLAVSIYLLRSQNEVTLACKKGHFYDVDIQTRSNQIEPPTCLRVILGERTEADLTLLAIRDPSDLPMVHGQHDG